MQRGHNRAASFFGDDDYHFYLHWLKKGAAKFRCDIHAYALMTNHVHLAGELEAGGWHHAAHAVIGTALPFDRRRANSTET